MELISRPFFPDEIRLLNKLKLKYSQKAVSRLKVYDLLLIFITGIAFADMATMIKSGLGIAVFGTLAGLCFFVVLFAPFERYQNNRRIKRKWSVANSLLMQNGLTVTRVNALQIALAAEYEDEGDLYLVAYKPDAVLYLWDNNYQLSKRLPCLNFDIYPEEFTRLTGRQVYTLSEQIMPLSIAAAHKWKYLKKYGSPRQLSTEEISMEDLIARF